MLMRMHPQKNLLLFLFLIYTSLASQDNPFTFDHITIKNGLSDGRIDCILQDSDGFLWLGTQDGLNRFDGYNFTVFDHDIFDSTSISSNWIRCILEDRFHQLWIGTEGGGLNRFEKETETFTRWTRGPNDPMSLNSNFVRALLEDSEGQLWVGTRNGLVRFDRDANRFLPFLADPSDSNSAVLNENITALIEDSNRHLWVGTSDDIFHYDREQHIFRRLTSGEEPERIATIFEDSYGSVWIGSRYQGLKQFDQNTLKFKQYRHRADNPASLSSDEIKTIFEDNDENLWIGTMHGGLDLFNRKTGTFERFKHNPRDPSSLSGNSVRSIYQDRTGVLWFGMDGSGLDRYVKNMHKFQLYGDFVDSPGDWSTNTVLSIFEDVEGKLWIGSEGGGLISISRENGKSISFKTEKGNSGSISSDQVTCLFEDREGIFWIGTKEGLNRFHRKKEVFDRYYVKTTPITGSNFINVMFEDQQGDLYIGTNSGLIRFDKTTVEFTSIPYDTRDVLNEETIVALCPDRDGFLWIGYLRSGLVKFDPYTQTFVHFRSDADNPASLSNNFVQYIYEDSSDRLWIATRKGLNMFDKTTGGFKRFTKTDGLPSNVIVSILEDERGNLWLGTTNGLSRFNVTAKTFTNFNVEDGLQGNQFWIHACFKSRSGELFFGGNNGFNAFYPGRIDQLANPNIPALMITNVVIRNNPLKKSVYAYTFARDTIRLSAQQNQISFEFSALDFTRPEKNQYAYWLEGFDTGWIYAGTRRYANYTNLAPGHYTFHVKGTNNDGVWSESGAAFSFFIPTPWWKTVWAYLSYVLAGLALIYGINAYIFSMVRVKHDLKIERMEKEKVKEINQFKLQFFTDIAHEFKTPLTLIQAPLDEILCNVHKAGPFEEEFRLMHRNVKYLLRLVHQLLFFRKAEQGRMTLEISKGDLIQFTTEIHELFEETARKHHIAYEFEHDEEKIEGWFDWEKIEEILVNLIDNAFKYTPDRGRITIRVDKKSAPGNNDGQTVLTVEDTGVGIAPDQIGHVFERFYHGGDGHHQNFASSGLGLALTQKLVRLHHGEIQVRSEEGKGACFIVTLPLGRDHFSEDEIIEDMAQTSHLHQLLKLDAEEAVSDEKGLECADSQSPEKPLILVVEDNAELRAYMKKTLNRNYTVAEAADGQEGLEKARSLLPNLIISDVIMPYVDGIELCQSLKNDLSTSHIPIILLTARNEIETKIQGIETGADDYIEKPFHFRFLDARIKNILESRQALRSQYRKELLLEPKEMIATSEDEKLLVRIRDYVEEHLEDPELNVKHVSSDIGLSRTMLFVKLKELTGMSPQEFIRTLRLGRAAQLLTKTDSTVSEIAYQSGFKYPKYFSTAFQKQYGMTPSDFRLQDHTSS